MNWMLALPEIVLACAGLTILMIGVLPRQNMFFGCTMASIGALVVTAALVLTVPDGAGFAGQVISDGFARFMKLLVLLGAAIGMLMALDFNRREGLDRFEYPVLLLFATLGMLIMLSANDFMTVYIGLELLSLSLYVVAAFHRDNEQSAEAGLKYFVLGALASGLFLYGASLVYGFAGTTSFERIALALLDPAGRSQGLTVGLIFILAALAFKVSAVPFHMWTPDVYEGSPTPVTAFFATAPKVAAMGLFARVAFDAFGAVTGEWQQIVAFLSVLSMFVGAIAAIGQTNIKRLMAYSSIAHMGFALMGLAAGSAFGVQAMLIYMAIYVTMNIGTFAFILGMEKDGVPVTTISSLKMYSKREPLRALAMLVLLFSLAGVPPMVGFFGKFYVLRAAYDAGLAWLAVAGVIASVIGAFYYLRIVYFMYFGEETEALDGKMSPVLWVSLMASAAVMVVGVVNLFGIEPLAAAAAATLVN